MIRLVIRFVVLPDRHDEFRAMYTNVYVPALSVQAGYLGSSLMRSFTPRHQYEIGGTTEGFDAALTLDFATEEDCRACVASSEYATAWAAAAAICEAHTHCGYDVVRAHILGQDDDSGARDNPRGPR